MKITNKHRLPEELLWVVLNDDYTRGDARWSATDLLKPVRQLHLMERHGSGLTEDVSDRLWSILGRAGHRVCEDNTISNAISEERIFADIETPLGKVRISGAADLWREATVKLVPDEDPENALGWREEAVPGRKRITDWKFTSVWSGVYGSRLTEWEQQLNIYAYLYSLLGFETEELYVIAIYRDWQRKKAETEPESSNYPRVGAGQFRLRLWSKDAQESFIVDRLTALFEAESLPDDELPECTAEQMWESPTRYALMKKGNKRASKVFDNEADAQAAISDPKHYVETRPGERERCERYCPASKVCGQYAEYAREREEKKQMKQKNTVKEKVA